MLTDDDYTESTGPEPINLDDPDDLPTDTTPTNHKQSTTIPFTSGHVMRDETLIALGNEMVGYVVGPMPAKEFLKFLPAPPNSQNSPSFNINSKKSFAILAEQSTEPKMYDPFIKAMKTFCPHLVGIDTSNTPMTTFSGKTIKPDIIYYNSSHSSAERADVESAELMVEAKFNQQDDPFREVPLKKEGFLCCTDRTKQTLGQLTSYATAHLAAQFRTHVFSILLFRQTARIMRWDRAGVIVSERISLDTPTLATFFWRFSNANATERGHDPTVTPFIFTKDLTKEFLFNQLQFAADRGNVKIDHVNFFEVLLPRENNRYVIGKATYLGVSSLASRATRSFKAWCLTTHKPVFLKDTWRIVSRSLSPEHEIYKKLAAAKVQHIATVLDHSDFDNHHTLTGEYAQKPWGCKVNLKPFRTLQHYRLVLKEIGRSLTSFTDFREVLAAMRSALQAHRESYYNGHILHRDISAGNVLIYNGGGLLIDWDMSKDLDLKSDDKNISRTGTWAFQSLRLSRRPEKNQTHLIHDRLDDLESFYHVLFWVSLQHARHEHNPIDLYDDLTRLFDHPLVYGDTAYSNRSKDSHMTSNRTLKSIKFQNPPLRELLLLISLHFKVLYIPPPTPDEFENTLLAELSQQDEELYETGLENYKKRLERLKSKEYSNWMEIGFDKALASDRWGPAGYISNKITPPLSPTIKRKYSDMRTSNIGYDQGGNFVDLRAGMDGVQYTIKNEDEEDEGEESDHSYSRRRFY